MKIKTSFISSSFDSNVYPRGIACVECVVQTKDNEISFLFVRKADDNNVESFVENDNISIKMAIQKAIKLLKSIENNTLDSINDFYYQENNRNLLESEKVKLSYKQKVIELMNLMNWNMEKLSKFVQKYVSKRLNELTEKEWYQVYTQLQQGIQNRNKTELNLNTKYSSEYIEDVENELIRPEEWDEII